MESPRLSARFIIRLLRLTINNWLEDKALRLSAALAYYSAFSIAPLLVIAISIAGLVLGDEAVKGHLDNQLRAYVGDQVAKALQSLVQSAAKPEDGWTGALIGFGTMLIGAAGVFGQLKDALNTIWEVERKEGSTIMNFVFERLWSFSMVLVIGFLLLTSLILTTTITALTDSIEHWIGLPPFMGLLLSSLISIVITSLLFSFIFKVLPDAYVQWRHVWTGALVTAVLFELGKFGLSYYLGQQSTTSSFGAAGSVILILLWVYYASCILFFGAEFTQVYAQEMGHEIQPAKGAVKVTRESRAQQGLKA